MKVKEFTLNNGMKVILCPNKKAPVVTSQVWVRTGSADEPKGLEGVSHFIEHLVFKGSDKYKVGEIAAEIEGHGGELNAYTSFDQTVFYMTLSKVYKEKTFEILSEMMGFPKFDAAEVDKEREVVIEEIRRSMDNPHRISSRALFSTLYKQHPYGVPVIGYEDNIKTMSVDKIKKYYSEHYVPENMTLVVVGDFEESDATPEIEKWFQKLPKSTKSKVMRPAEESQEKARINILREDFEEKVFHMAWPVPEITHPDAYALEILAAVLGHGESSRLMRSLFQEKQLAKYSVSHVYLAKDPGFFAITSSPVDGKVGGCLSEIINQLKIFFSSGALDTELERIKNNYKADAFYSLETANGYAQKIGNYNDLYGNPLFQETFLKNISNVTADDLIRVAKEYLSPKHLNIIAMFPKDYEEDLDKEFNDFKDSYEEVFSDFDVSQAKGAAVSSSKDLFVWGAPEKNSFPVELAKLSSDKDLVYKKDNNTPVVSLRWAFEGGMRLESQNSGCAELASRCWLRDTTTASEAEFVLSNESLSAYMGSFTGRNTFGLQATFLSPVKEKALENLGSSISKKVTDESLFNREKTILLEEIQSESDKPSSLCINQFMESSFPGLIYANKRLGKEENVKALDLKTINSFIEETLAQKSVISCVGDINKDEVSSWAQKYKKPFEVNSLLSSVKTAEQEIKPEHQFLKSEKEQTHFVMGYKSLPYNSPQKYTMSLLQAVLSGQGGRLFIELRDKESLAYTVSPIRVEGLEMGMFGAYIACAPDKLKKSYDLMKIEFDKLMQVKLTDDEIERSKRFLIGKHDIRLQKNSYISSEILYDHLYGLNFNETYNFLENISKVTADDVQKLAQSIFSGPAITSVVGQSDLF